MIASFTAAAAVVPGLLLVWYFHSRDRNREPARTVWVTFLLGVLITIPAGLVEMAISSRLDGIHDPVVHGLLSGFVVAAIPEEAFKFAVVTRYSARQRAFDEPMDGIVYGAVASLGFATFENILYVGEGGAAVAAMRALTAVPAHACTGAIMGYYVGQARFAATGLESSRRALYAGFCAAVLLHGLYDFPLMAIARAGAGGAGVQANNSTAQLLLITLAVLSIDVAWTRRLVARLRRDQDEAALAAAPGALVSESVVARALELRTGAVAASPARHRHVITGLLSLAGGGALSTVGTMALLGFALDRTLWHAPPAALAISLLLIAGLLLGGVRLFRAGLRRLHG